MTVMKNLRRANSAQKRRRTAKETQLLTSIAHAQMKRQTELIEKKSFPQLWTVRATTRLYADHDAEGLASAELIRNKHPCKSSLFPAKKKLRTMNLRMSRLQQQTINLMASLTDHSFIQ